MGTDEIRAKVKQAIAKVSKIDPREIADDASYRDDLGLDSLSILETIVEVQSCFKIPDKLDTEFLDIRTVEETVKFIEEWLCLQMV
jgi:acyl carrier protein